MEKERHSATSPNTFLAELNNGLGSILQKTSITMFATAFYTLVDLKEKTITFACAGHPMPLIANEKGISLLEDSSSIKGPALGLIPQVQYQCSTLDLNAIKQFILYTDGIYETENPDGEQIGIEAIADSITTLCSSSIEETLDQIIETTHQYSQGQGFGDDVCLLGFEIEEI